MKQGVFIETKNVNAFRTALGVVRDTVQGNPGIMVVRGQAGRGKTFAAEREYAQGGGVFIRAWEDLTQAGWLRLLCKRATDAEPHGALACKERIIESLGQDPRPVFVDEADRLHIKRIEDLRDIHDATGCPMILIGEMGLYAQLHARRRIWSRVVQHVEFGPVSEEDVILYAKQAAGLSTNPDAAQAIVAASDGDFRLVYGILLRLEQAAEAIDTTIITATMVQAAKAGK